MATDPASLDADFGTDALPAEGDARAPEPSQARRTWGRLRASLREGIVLLLLVVCGSQVLVQNEAVPDALKPKARPALFQAVIEYPRIFQGWSMFAPEPPKSDGRLVIDGRTKDGRQLDPLTGQAPVFEVHPPGAPRMNLIWGYFHIRIAEDRFRGYWSGVRDFLMSHHKLTGNPQDELTSFEAYYVTQAFVPPGVKAPPPEKLKLFSSSNVPGAENSSSPAVAPRSKPKRPGAQ
jgi:hypothetical protein